VLAYYLLLMPLLFVLALLIPLWIINRSERLRRPVLQRYVFG